MTAARTSDRSIVVTGASGHLGRFAVERLIDLGLPVVAVTRNVEALADLAAQGIVVRYGDFGDPNTLDPAFAGATELLIIPTHEPGAGRIELHRNAIAAARRADVGYLVYTSGVRARFSTDAIENDQAVTEQLIAEAELPHTIIRESIFTDLIAEWLPTAATQGVLRAPAGHAGASFIWREDCAYAAVALLEKPQPENNLIVITGPELVTYADVAVELSDVVGREIPYVEESLEEARQRVFGTGADPLKFNVELSVATAVARGAFELLTSSFEELTGRPPRTIREYLHTHKGLLLSE